MKTSKLFITGLFILLAFNLMAQIPQTISFQGILKDSNGDPVADNTYTMEFELFDALSGGNSVWGPEVHAVQTKDGLYSVLLGSVNQAFDYNHNFQNGYYLQLKVNTETMADRIPLSVSPYAFIARSVQGQDNIMPSSGNVGIGTTTPSTELEVSGTVTATSFVGDGSGLTGLPYNPFTGDATSASYDGNVGIGTATPTTKLDVTGTVTATEFVGGGSGLTGLPINPWSGNIDSTYTTGKVGIGTTTPSTTLHIEGNMDYTFGQEYIGIKIQNSNIFGKSLINLENDNNTGYSISVSGSDALNAGFYPGFEIVNNNSILPMFNMDPNSINLLLGVDDNITLISGGVGIGTQSPEAGLHIVSHISQPGIILQNLDNESPSISFKDNNLSGGQGYTIQYAGPSLGANNLMFLNDNSGTPMLSFDGNATVIGRGVGSNPVLAFSEWGTSPYDWYITSTDQLLSFVGPDDVPYLVLENLGNIGIGRDDPATALDVNGTVTARHINVTNAPALDGTVTAEFFVGDGSGLTGTSPWTGATDISYSGGNVGIGTASPTTALDVNGAIKTTGLNLQDGNEATDRVLKSDANGNASWGFLGKNTLIGNVNDDIPILADSVTLTGSDDLLFSLSSTITKLEDNTILEVICLPNMIFSAGGMMGAHFDMQIRINSTQSDYGADYYVSAYYSGNNLIEERSFYFTNLSAGTYSISLYVNGNTGEKFWYTEGSGPSLLVIKEIGQ